MQPILSVVPALAVSMVYCLWQMWYRVEAQRHRRLRERVAFMLWEIAQREDEECAEMNEVEVSVR